jgi:chromosomal replication initiator protein
VIDVPEPDLELRAAILLIKARQKKINFPQELATTVAEVIEHPRQLEGFLVKIQNEIAVKPQEISKELVGKLLGKQLDETAARRIVSPQDVINLAANYFGISVGQLKGERRSQPLAFQRQILMYILRSELRLPLTEIGRVLGGRDHTTVLHATDKIKAEMAEDTQLQRDLEAMKKLVYG